MSRLEKRKTRLIVEFSETVRSRGKHREIVMELSPYGLQIRLKGLRTSLPISPGAIYDQAAKLEANRVLAEKRAAKAAKHHR